MYNDTNNFLVYGGVKFREGLSKHASGNLIAFANGPDQREVPFATQVKGTSNSFESNTIISGTGQCYGACAMYNVSETLPHVAMDHNIFYTPNRSFDNGGCGTGAARMGFSQWQQAGLGQDKHSEVRDLGALKYSEVLQAGRQLLGMAPSRGE